MQNTPSLTNLLDDAAILSLEHQLYLGEVVGEHDWRVDLKEPRFEFTGGRTLTCERFHLLGSAAPGPGSWMWSWASPSGFAPQLTQLSESVRDLGQRYGIPELSNAEIPFGALPGSPEDPNLVAGILTEAAKALTGSWTSYTGDAGGGTRVAFLVEHPEFRLPPPAADRTLRVIQQALTDVHLTDHKRALHAYAVRRGLGAEFSPDGTHLTITAPGFEVNADFDELNRVVRLDGTMSSPSH